MLHRMPLSVSIFCGLFLSACYGDVRDASRVTSTVILPDQQVAIAYHEHRFRPARGITAFPDGGVPKVIRDRFIVALVGPRGVSREILRWDNDALSGTAGAGVRWFPDDPAHLYVLFSAQRTTSLPLQYLSEQRRVDLDRGVQQRFDLEVEVRVLGRSLGVEGFGEFYPLARDGTLLVGAESEGQRELWVRPPSARYRKLASFDRFDGQADEAIVYSLNGPPFTTYAVNWKTGARRTLLRYNASNTGHEFAARDDPAFRRLNEPSAGAAAAEKITVSDDGHTLRYQRGDETLWSTRIRF